MEEAKKQSYNEWAQTRTQALAIRLLKSEIATLVRVMSVWTGDIDRHADWLFCELRREDTSEDSAFQDAGLHCHCLNRKCDFPFTINNDHRHL